MSLNEVYIQAYEKPTVPPVWVVMPVMGAFDLTEAAIADCLAQTVYTRVLVILQAVPDDVRHRLEAIAEEEPRLLVWSHQPTLPSLAATWNRALRFVWETGGTEALVVNADVRLHRQTVEVLCKARAATDALFVSAVGVTAEQFNPDAPELEDFSQRGGPDFSCYLMTKEGHDRLQFDEACIPAYLEDLMYHREMLLGGEGHRIFSINFPFHHIGSGSSTLKSMTPEKRTAHERRIEQGSRAHYLRCWGGPANRERYTIKGDPSTSQDGVTTPELQRLCLAGGDASRDAVCTTTGDSSTHG